MLSGMVTACRKRPVTLEDLQDAAERVERDLFDLCETEVPSTEIGERVMAQLFRLDTVAYVRFASVYREFETLSDFIDIVESVVAKKHDITVGALSDRPQGRTDS